MKRKDKNKLAPGQKEHFQKTILEIFCNCVSRLKGLRDMVEQYKAEALDAIKKGEYSEKEALREVETEYQLALQDFKSIDKRTFDLLDEFDLVQPNFQLN